MKYKVGDRVRVRENLERGRMYDRYGFTHSMASHRGRLATIEVVRDESYCIDVDGWAWAWTDAMLETVSKTKSKSQPIQFIAVYDERSGDPHKLFTTRKELTDWLKEAKDTENIIWSSIKVFKVKGQYEVKTSFRLKKM